MALRNRSNRIVTSIRYGRYYIDRLVNQSIFVEVSKPETLALIAAVIVGALA